MFKRLFVVFTGSVAVVFMLGVTRLIRPLRDWIYDYPFHDKIAHFVVGAFYTFLLIWCFKPRQLKIGQFIIPLGAPVMFGLALIDELLQIPLRGRDANPYDLLAGVVGISFAVLLWNLWIRSRERVLAGQAEQSRS
jgi:VanZ family protein